MFGASPFTPPRAKLTTFHIAVASPAQAHAIQRFLWCLWVAALSRVATTTVIDGQSFVSSIAYDNQGRPKHAVYPQATSASAPLALTTSYNASGYANEVKHATTGQSYWKIDVGGRNDDGQLKQATLGGILTINPSHSGDGLGHISTINVTSGANPLLAQTFDFESAGNLKARSLTGTGRTENEAFAYDTLDRLLQTSGTGITDTGSNSLDLAGNLSSKAGLLLGYQSGSNRLCAIGASTCGAGAGTGNMAFDANGNIQSYTRPTQAQSNNAPGADGAFLQLSGYTAFNLPTSITKSLGGTIQASAEFGYDAGYQRTRQIKRSGPTQTGTFVDDILYVVPGGFEVHRNATGQIIKGIATLSGSDGVVATVTTNFDTITGIPPAQLPTAQNGFDISSNNSGVNTVTQLILKDHLGSMVAEITLGGTPQAPTVLVNTLSIHGFGPWGNARNQTAALAEGQRGFTGHEHLAELGIIHMNGRLYDPVIGRFLQADPIIQAPHNAQSHNRYAYVLNNPLSFTDPSGFSAWTQWRAPILGAMGVAAGTTANFINAVASGFAAGSVAGGNIQSALQGVFTAALTFGVGEFSGAHSGSAMSLGQRAGQIAGHAAVGCASASMAGESCKAGAMAQGFSAFAGNVPGVKELGLFGRAAVEAIASRLGGGKAENGALSGAFEYLFNELAHGGGPGSEGFDAGGSQSWVSSTQASRYDVAFDNISNSYFCAQAEFVGIGLGFSAPEVLGARIGAALATRIGTFSDYVRWEPTTVSNQLIEGVGSAGAQRIWAIKGGGLNRETGFNLPFHHHVHQYNWYKPWTWFEQTPVLRAPKG